MPFKLGEARFTTEQLDGYSEVAGTSNWFGYYDVNVMQMALNEAGYDLTWFDDRKDLAELANGAEVLGYVVNVSWKRFFFFTSHHWYCIRKFSKETASISASSTEESYIVLDSQAKKPSEELDRTSLLAFLAEERQDRQARILILRKK